MRAILLKGYNKGIYFDKIKKIELKEKEKLLVKVKYASINPSDLGYIAGVYGRFQRIDFPHVVGFEGSGIIEGTSSELTHLKGKKVAFVSNYEKQRYLY